MVKFENIEIKYGDFVAIENLNLDIKEGEFFTFLGPSGCGKTTSLRALVGFLSPSKGKVYVGDKDVTNLPVEKRNIGMVFQSYALFPTMSVYDNIAFGMKVKKASKTEIDQKVHEVAAKIKITESQLKKNVSDLSGGQQQRVALARAIVLEPKILCLDEPLSNLDAKLRIDMRMELKRLQKELGITTLYVTHDQEEALTLSDRIAVFNNGYVEQVGTPYEIYNESKSEFVCDFIGDINRLKGELLSEVNTQSGANLDTNKTGFVRIERCISEEKASKTEIDQKVHEVAAKIKITESQLKKNVSDLSGGQQQRVALARAIVLEPKILCLDEPLSNLDAKLRIDMRMELKRLQKELGITTLYVTHDQEEALTLSDRIAVFNNGYVEQVGTPYEIYNESKSEFVCDFIGDINRLKGELLSEVNTQSGANLDTNKTGFVRIERCISEEKAGYVKLTGKVEEAEFSGVLTKYVLECHGQELKYLEKNDGRRLYQENEQIDLYINPQDIMQF